MIDLFNNKTAFLKEKPKMGFIIVILILLILLILLIFICKKEIYDSYQTKGLVSCTDTCTITTSIPSNLEYDYIQVNNKYLNYEILSEKLIVDEENLITYNQLTLSTELSLSNNEIIDLTIYYNKQRIITKIKDKMF